MRVTMLNPEWRPYFGWQSEQVIQNTYKVIPRFGGTIPHHEYLKKHVKSRDPVFNIPGKNESVVTDPFSATPLLSMMEVQWHNFLLARMLWYVMHMELKVKNSLSTHFMITSSPGEP